MRTWIYMVIAACGVSCTQKPVQTEPSKEELMDYNKLALKKESVMIDRYVEAQQWPVVTSGSGLRYYIYQPGAGDSVRTEDRITVKMTITLLNGDTCYSHLKYGPEAFTVDYDHHESGLHEAVKKMTVGSKAKVILPSHLAFGVAGDHDKIPMRATVVYDLEIVSKN